MLDESQICPYTGLRAFTEEESLYFKGREEHIQQATEQLQRNKFLMLTGASGDGKSSLVYAGIIPNARAGFLKSKYTQWCVADFRPERTPFRNLVRSVANQLGISHAQTAEAELQHGFSALVDLYKNSSRFVDTQSTAWQQADDRTKNAMKREAANLIVIVDQFEEFFTNPENYSRGVPSSDSNLVLNLLLETARIALDENLPIYVVFTMRSDYIGQCASFRMLPEYIGFSQFFVPRLNRSQLQQVIEEPAVLSGNKITRRLTERLIHDVAEGVDQLPILQHTLNQVWHAAANGKDEMDLLHYAMVGGMKSFELPDDQKPIFDDWFRKLPDNIKSCYREPDLQNVLDTHANKLYEATSGSQQTGNLFSEQTAKAVIKKAFICLTKIDQSRAVRNRMTLAEIHCLLNQAVPIDTLGIILDRFREPGNTFIRPFMHERPKLNPDDVLDITHESLIRNWELLEQWAREEDRNFTIYLDFKLQVERWVESKKSNDFLLSLGPLGYFEKWYNNLKPNAWWIARYQPEDVDPGKKLATAEAELDVSREFLKKSATKHAFTRAMVRLGPRRMAAGLAILGVIILSSFGIKGYIEQKNSAVLERIKQESIKLAGNRKVALDNSDLLLCENVRLGLTTIPEIAAGIQDPILRVSAITGMTTSLVLQGNREPYNEIRQGLATSDSLLELFPVSPETPKYSEVLQKANDLMSVMDLAYHFNSVKPLEILAQRNAARIASWVMLIASQQPASFKDISGFNVAIENAINHRALSEGQIQQLITFLAPFEKRPGDSWVGSRYARDNSHERGAFHYGFAFNGLYQEAAYLFAAIGDWRSGLRCVDSLVKYNDKYHERNYEGMIDNSVHVAATFYKYGKVEAMDEFIRNYSLSRNKKEDEFYQKLIMQCRVSTLSVDRYPYFQPEAVLSNPILLLANEDQLDFFHTRYRRALTLNKNDDERNFWLAISYKTSTIDKNLLLMHGGGSPDRNMENKNFDSACFFFDKVSSDFKNKRVSMYNLGETYPLKFVFKYPDLGFTAFPGEPRAGYSFYTSTRFMQYILESGKFDYFFSGDDELGYLEEWLTEYRPISNMLNYNLRSSLDRYTLTKLEMNCRRRAATSKIDFSEVDLLLGNSFTRERLLDSASYFYSRTNPAKLVDITNANGNYGMYQVALAMYGLILNDKWDEACKLVLSFKKPANRTSLYGFVAQSLLRNKIESPFTDRLIDSARVEMLRTEAGIALPPGRFHVPYALAMRLHEGDLSEIAKVIKNVPFKGFSQQHVARSLAFNGKLHEAYLQISPTVAASERAVYLWNILYGYSESLPKSNDKWKEYNDNHQWFNRRLIFYNNENI